VGDENYGNSIAGLRVRHHVLITSLTCDEGTPERESLADLS